MKPKIIIGIVVAVVILGIISSQLGGESERIDNVMPVAEEIIEVDAAPIVSEVDVTPVVEETIVVEKLNCLGTAKCFTGIVTKVIDGDTLKVNGESIRFSLASAPELKGYGGVDSKNFIETICPVGSTVTVDEDDGYVIGSYGRIVGLVHCNGVNLSSELLDSTLGYLDDRFCDSSEFAELKWAQKHGCAKDVVVETTNDCDESYPDFCIASSPPDLDCSDISQKKFTVLQPDPHKFDGDKDGIGCE